MNMIECPKCGFVQPQDRYCAKCGVDIEVYRQKNRPGYWSELFRGGRILAFSGFFLIGGGLGYLTYFVMMQSRLGPQEAVPNFRVEGVAGAGAVTAVYDEISDQDFNRQVSQALMAEAERLPASVEDTKIKTVQSGSTVEELEKKEASIDLEKLRFTASLVEAARSWADSPVIDTKMRESFQARELVRLNLSGDSREGFVIEDVFLLLDIGELQVEGGEVVGVMQGILQIPGAAAGESAATLTPIAFGSLLRMMPGPLYLWPIDLGKMTPEQALAARASWASAPSGVARGLAELLGSRAFMNGESQLFLLLNLPVPRESN